MADFVILTDSAGDLSAQMAEELGIHVLPLVFTISNRSYSNYPDEREMSSKTFYDMLRSGERSTTSAANPEQFTTCITPVLQEEKDVLVLCFSSGLSSTYNTGASTAEALSEEYPGRKIYVVDTLGASMGHGLMVYLAAQEKAKGKSIEEVRDFVEGIKLNLCHWFTVDDLHHLKRGGRVSATTALIGTVLNIKPVLHVDNSGHLVSMSKARGRKAALKALADKMEATATNPAEQTVFISHGDCLEDAEWLAGQIKERMGTEKIFINCIGPVVGSHSGPGTIALFFVGTER